YASLGHIITGDVSFIHDPYLQFIFSFVSKFREHSPLNWDDVRSAAYLALGNWITILQHKWKLLLPAFSKYREVVSALIEQCIRFINMIPPVPAPAIPSSSFSSEYYIKLTSKFVVVPADKASNNFIICCKKLYVSAIAQELGITVNANKAFSIVGNFTYQPVLSTQDALILQHKTFAQRYGIQLDKQDLVIPKLFAVPKLHKVPYKFRFIAGANKSSTKKLSCILTRILSFLKTHFQTYCKTITHRSSQNVYWSIDNSLSVLNMARGLKSPKTVITADFSTLYTCFSHSLIKQNLGFLVNLLFKHSNKEFIALGYLKTFYTNDSTGVKNGCYSKLEILQLIDFILDNTFVKFSQFIFKQVCGIPMGGNASPLIADLTLSIIEFRYLNSSTHVHECRLLKLTSRFIDDLI
ncbi:MAG: hypothetical protein GY853_13130, partial [PVC group bacterium]|nr:hypothetical protein [PVC group bacterium]